MTRNGKIARLSRHIRHELNQRLDDGEQGKDLIEWLNGLEPVKEMLARDFGGRPISEQNLTEWKQGGFLEWQRAQESCERVRRLVDLSDDFDDATDDKSIPQWLAGVFAAELAAETQKLLEETTDPKERWRYLCEALKQLGALRQGDYTALRAAIDRDRWEVECEKREAEEIDNMVNEARDNATAPIWAALKRPVVVKAFGGGEIGETVADFLNDIDENCRYAKARYPFPGEDNPPPDLSRYSKEAAQDLCRRNQKVKPKSSRHSASGGHSEATPPAVPPATPDSSRHSDATPEMSTSDQTEIKPDQTKSK